MKDIELDRLLTPMSTPGAESPEVLDAMLTRLADDARADAMRAPRRRLRRQGVILAGAVLLAVGGATAGEMYPTSYFEPDVVIPIIYTTVAGREVQCTQSVAVTSWRGSDISAAKEWVAGHDWTGIGQRGYDYALEHPVEATDPGVDPALTQDQLDRFTISRGMATVLTQEIPFELLDTVGVGTVATSTCRWDRY